ncbi:MAG: uracil-DNA glycosylase [Paracoccaceae bacterium]
MTSTGLSDVETRALLVALAWQVEMGVDECIGEGPANRFEERPPPPAAKPTPAASPAAAPALRAATAERDHGGEAITEARRLAAAAPTLEALHEAIAGFDGCALKLGARNTVFADGNPGARVMFIGEAPGREEDREGKPFVGRSGQLLDRMLAAIGLDRRASDPARAAYITNVLPWRPVDNRDPSTDEAVMLWAFLQRHIELADPEIIVTLGKTPASVMLEGAISITRMRGRWLRPARALGRPLLLTFHPAYLLRQPAEKAKSWRDLLALRAVLDGAAPPEG